ETLVRCPAKAPSHLRCTPRQLCTHCAASIRKRRKASRSWLRGSCRQLHVELVAQCGKTRVVAIRDEEGCDGELHQARIVRGIGGFEPLKHLFRFFSDGVKHGNLKGPAGRILGDKIIERGVGRRLVAICLSNQSDRVIAPETFGLAFRICHRLLWTVLQNIEQSEEHVKTRSPWLKLKSLTKRL